MNAFPFPGAYDQALQNNVLILEYYLAVRISQIWIGQQKLFFRIRY
jgi:hypothetical protein